MKRKFKNIYEYFRLIPKFLKIPINNYFIEEFIVCICFRVLLIFRQFGTSALTFLKLPVFEPKMLGENNFYLHINREKINTVEPAKWGT